MRFSWKKRELLTSCDPTLTDSNTILEVLKTALLKTIEVCWTKRKISTRKLGGGTTVSVTSLRKGMFGRRGKAVKRNTWLLREDLELLVHYNGTVLAERDNGIFKL